MRESERQPVQRVLMTVDAVGGVWTYALELAGALGAHGIEVILVRMGPCPTSEQRRAVARLPGVQLVGRPYRLEWMDDAWIDVDAAGEWLLRLTHDFAPDLIHLNGYSHAALPWEQPVLVVGHSCVLSWMRSVKGVEARPHWGEYHRRVREGLTAADHVVAPTAAMLSALRHHYGDSDMTGEIALEARSRVIPNGRSGDTFQPRQKDQIVFAAGRIWDEAKNARRVAAVAPRLAWPVCLAGERRRPEGEEVVFEGVRNLGRLEAEAMASWFGRAAIFAHPARYEPFGLTPLEAGLSGCALVLGDIENLREVWADAAHFVDPDDEDALEEILSELIANPVLRHDFANRARERALEFTPERMADRYIDLYREMAEAGRSTGGVLSR